MEKFVVEYVQKDQYTFKEKSISFYQKHKFPITLEPVVFFGSLSYGLSVVNSGLLLNKTVLKSLFQVIRSQLILDKICQNKLSYSSEICENLTNYEEIQKEVQKQVTDYEAFYSTWLFFPK